MRLPDLNCMQWLAACRDLILVDFEDVSPQSGLNWEGALMAAAHAGDVDTVLVAGRTLKSGARLTRPDVGEVLETARRSGRRLLELISKGG